MTDLLTDIDYKLKLLSLKQFSYKSKDSESLIDEIEDSMGTSEELTSGEIFNIVSSSNDTVEDVDTEQDVNIEEVDSVITIEEAKTCFQNLFKFFESKRAFEDNKLIIICIIKLKILLFIYY